MNGSAARGWRLRGWGWAVVLAAGLAPLALAPAPAQARSAGIESGSFSAAGGCNDCHSGGVAPQVALSGSVASLAPGEAITLVFVVTSASPLQIAAGFNVRSSQRGTFAVGGPFADGTRTIVSGATGWLEATHSTPRAAIEGVATFSTVWTPDADVTGTVTFSAWGNSVNRATGRTGDRASGTTLDITVCAPVALHRDGDGDGFGNPGEAITACSPREGYVADATDCNDGDAAVHPGASEVCNGRDDSCDGVADENLGSLTCGEDPCQTTVPACVEGVAQTCTAICPPPPPDAAPPSPPDAGGSDTIHVPGPGHGGLQCHAAGRPLPGGLPVAGAAFLALFALGRRQRRR